MYLVVNLFILAVGIILINAEPLEEKLQSGSVQMRDSSEDPMLSFYKEALGTQRNDPIPLVGLVIKARRHRYCLRRLSSLGESRICFLYDLKRNNRLTSVLTL